MLNTLLKGEEIKNEKLRALSLENHFSHFCNDLKLIMLEIQNPTEMKRLGNYYH